MVLDVYQCIWPEPEPDSVMSAAMLCMLMMCMKLCNLRINCSVLMSVIGFVLLLLHIVMRNICLIKRQFFRRRNMESNSRACLFECQLVLTNDLELTRCYDVHFLMLLYDKPSVGFISRKL